MKKNCPVCTQSMTDLLDSAICQQDGHQSWIESEFSWSVRMLLNDDNDSQVDISAYDLAGINKATVLDDTVLKEYFADNKLLCNFNNITPEQGVKYLRKYIKLRVFE